MHWLNHLRPSRRPEWFAGAGHDRKGPAQLDRRGRHLDALASAPPLFLVAWADSKTVVGVTTQGSLAVSANAGRSWRTDLATASNSQALSASRDPAGGLEILVVTDKKVLQSRDSGVTVTTLKP